MSSRFGLYAACLWLITASIGSVSAEDAKPASDSRKPAAIEECLGAVFAAIPYCIDIIGGPRFETTPGAPTAFRPQGV